ncbi:MAG TPA: hypothetical protein VN962_07000 [Polyangia bacterium]|nr:hypothetical protein [Polyangia bacterium]
MDVFKGIVRRRLGYDTFRADAPNLVVVRIEAAGRALEGQIEWQNATGASIGGQTFPSRSGDCGELTLAMGFALALQIQLLASTVPEPGKAPPPPTRPTPPAASAPPPAPAARTESVVESRPTPPPAPAGPAFWGGAGASAGFGVSSDTTALARLFATAAWPHMALELAGEMTVPSTTWRASGGGFSQEQLLASLAACWVRGAWNACAVGKMGELRVKGQSVDVPLSAAGLMVQTGARLAYSRALGQRSIIAARVEGLARVTEGTVTLDATPVWTTPRFAALLGIDVAVRFR